MGMEKLIGKSMWETKHSLIECLEKSAGSRRAEDNPSEKRFSFEGVSIIAFWLLVLALNVFGWYLLFHRAIPFVGHWFRH